MSSQPEVHTTEVDLSGLLQVLGTNLYSTPEVAVRELVQNAHDACTRRQIEFGGDFAPEITVGVSAGRRLWIEDNGAGLTREEMKRYLATIGAGYTRVLRTASGDPALIGAFGLGFLSAYMIGRRVEVHSTSAADAERGVRFVSDSGRTYAIDSTEPRAIGSRVEIELNEACAGLADMAGLARVLRSHCRLLGAPVRLAWSGEQVNDLTPPWRQDLAGVPPIRRRRERLAFAREFESHFEPLCAMPIGGEGEGEVGRGLLWIHDAGTYGSADNRRLQVFVRGMRVCANERDLLPAWAGFVSGVFESDALTPTASREDLQKDEAYDAARRQIAAALSAGLARLAQEEPEAWRRAMRRHNEALLGGAVADRSLFEALGDQLQLPTSMGEMTGPEILAASNRRLHLSMGEGAGADGMLARCLGVPVIDGLRYAAAAFARDWAAAAGVSVLQVGTAKGLRELFPAADLPSAELEALKAWFGDGVAVRPARFQPADLPLLVVWDEEAATKAFIESDEADARLGAGVLAMARLFTQTVEQVRPRTVVVNLDCPVVAAILTLRGTPRGEAAAALLIAMAELLAGRDRPQGGPSQGQALSAFTAALATLLEDGRG